MNHLWNLVKKEVKELLTPSSIISVVAVCVVLIILGSTIGGEVGKQSGPQHIGYIDMDVDHYSSGATDGLTSYYEHTLKVDPDEYVINLTSEVSDPTDTDSIRKAMESHDLSTCVIILKGYTTSVTNYLNDVEGAIPLPYYILWNQTSASVFSALSTATGTNAAAQMSKGVYQQILTEEAPGGKIEKAQYFIDTISVSGSTFFHGEFKEGVTPDQIYSAISSQTIFVPMIIMLIIVMIGSILISSMGNEKENKTLETLLTLPIGRTTIVGGKLIGCAIAGVVMGSIYMIGMYCYISGLNISRGGTSLSDLGLALNAGDWVIVALSVFLAIMCALGMCMILGAFAKNYKAAQTYVMPISVLAVIPMFVTMFTSFDTLPTVIQGVLFLIPFTHPMMILQNIMFGNWALIIGGLVYLVIFASAMIYITVRLYKSDILLTGLLKNDDKKFSFSNLFNKSRQ